MRVCGMPVDCWSSTKGVALVMSIWLVPRSMMRVSPGSPWVTAMPGAEFAGAENFWARMALRSANASGEALPVSEGR
jgi:hypothetical protein